MGGGEMENQRAETLELNEDERRLYERLEEVFDQERRKKGDILLI
jgi:hypothetical protein